MQGEERAIIEIRAVDVLGEFGYTVNFANRKDSDRMRLIYAQNGRGKTNFLRAVNSALIASPESLQSLIEIPFRLLRIAFASGGLIEIERKQQLLGSYTARVTTQDSTAVEISVDPADFSGRLYRRVWDEREDYSGFSDLVSSMSTGAVFIGDDRLTPALEEGREGGRGESSLYGRRRAGSVSRLLETVERMLTQAALVSLSRENAQTGIYGQITRTTLQGASTITASTARAALEEQIARLLSQGTPLERYELLSMRQIRDIDEQINGVRANNRQLPAVHRILKPYFDSLEDQIRSLTPAQELIDTYVTSVNKFLDRKKLLFTASKGVRLIGRDGARLHPENLSSGERHLLLLVSQSVLATTDRPLVIIDEPELSLGIEWQRDLLPELLRCSQSGNVQFLVASHSVQVMSAVERNEIVRPSEVE